MGNIVTANFRGDELFGFESDDGTFVALKPIVKAMGLDWNAQRQRLNRDPILSEGTCVMHVPFGCGGAQETTCLKLELVNGWLFTIDSSRIKDETVKAKVLVYQRECYGVLFENFYRGAKLPGVEIPADSEAHEPETGRIRMVTEARQTFGTRAAGQLWFILGLPIAMMEQKRQLDLIEFSRIKTADGSPAA
ncbi:MULTISPECIES: phage antirepressor N-terminal domain-containing protein [unclassified Aureimonas]|uniref:phage antirepressor N-terminal domain-containing protein n=1 Tax=unclassified Aureimonas TaxID=2615206 RepID=UPI0006F86FE6|nr:MULTISPECIES: phage antirepressor N-terminal domain-containing protein [unclassified Aureimonas]KQT53799.1 hypothetical protein ASG62_11145 [Aureimonas sp. Leaf427]KQT71760.1 hypothetical protein ASG54_20015 [Aureimonas sp. Leaf460]